MAGLQESSVQRFPSSQFGGGPPAQAPPLQVSAVVQASPSLQGAVLLVFRQPVAGLQESLVQTFPSSQLAAGPLLQAPPLQASPTVQASPSSQGAVLLALTQPVAGSQESSVQVLLSSQFGGAPPTHAPALHVSAVVQASPSLQGTLLLAFTQPVAGSQESLVHTFPSSQFAAGPLLHAPLLQVSPTVQASPSSQGAVLLLLTHPVAGSQESLVHVLPSSQLGAGPPTQAPPLQASAVVQASPSLQANVLLALTHPVAGSQESSVQTFPSSQTGGAPPTQAPALQVSAVVQASPSSQAAVLLVLTHPVAGSQLSSVHELPSSQSGAGPPTQAPLPHVSAVVQASPSSQAAVLFVLTHPVAGSHESSVQILPSSQTGGGPPLQAPPPQVSPDVQASPSSQAAVLLALTQPVAGSQESSVHGLPSSHTTGVPEHDPPEHTSEAVQALPSSQAAVLFAFTQPVAGSHESSVQTLPSSQSGGAPPTHDPPLQVSTVVQASPSLHAAVLLALTQPVAGSQESSVQTLLSSQFSAGPPMQAPPLQVSDVVQALPSSQASVLAVFTQPVTGSQVSSVQVLPSSQLRAGPTLLQFPPPSHSSAPSQTVPLSQAVPDVSKLQSEAQQSPATSGPGSQSSVPSTVPLPHTATVQSESDESISRSPSLSRPSFRPARTSEFPVLQESIRVPVIVFVTTE
jgi:hypothetical protein